MQYLAADLDMTLGLVGKHSVRDLDKSIWTDHAPSKERCMQRVCL